MTTSDGTPEQPAPVVATWGVDAPPAFCTVCGARLGEGARFCPSCGTAVTPLRWSGPAAAPGNPLVTLGGSTFALASFWRRLGATLIDGVAWSTVTQVITVQLQPSISPFDPALTDDEGFEMIAEFLPWFLTSNAIIGVLGAAVFIALYAYGWSPGRAALGLRILRSDGCRPGFVHGAARYGAAFLSSMVFLLGYLWMLWDPQRQTWHDKIARTYVVSVGDQPVPPVAGGSLAISGWAWAWACLTVGATVTVAAGSLYIASILPRDGDAYRRFFEGLAEPPARSRTLGRTDTEVS